MWNPLLFRRKYPPGLSVKIIDDGSKNYDYVQKQMIDKVGIVVFTDMDNEWINIKTDIHQSDFYESQVEIMEVPYPKSN